MSYNVVFYDSMRSITEHHVQLCCENFSLRSDERATGSISSIRAVDDLCWDKVDDDMARNVQLIVKLAKTS